jgi:hypothetical protein
MGGGKAMNQDDIIRMAREQGLPETEVEGVFRVNSDDLGRLLAAEREECAKWFDSEEDRPFYGRHVAAAIRKRGQG